MGRPPMFEIGQRVQINGLARHVGCADLIGQTAIVREVGARGCWPGCYLVDVQGTSHPYDWLWYEGNKLVAKETTC